MSKALKEKRLRRVKRKRRIRGRLRGTAERPRLTVFRSNRHLYAQVVDDVAGVTLASISSLAGSAKGLKPTVEDAGKMGEMLGTDLKAKKIENVVFDRNGFLYHGVVKSFAEGVRKAGLVL
jgi:large subunit ribosomal protein L18